MQTIFNNQNLLDKSDLLKIEITPRKLDESPLTLDSIDDKTINAKMISHPPSIQSEKLWLYYEGEKGKYLGSGADYPKYFLDRGYEVLENPAPSLLIDAAKQLKAVEEIMWKLNIEKDTNIILISTPPLFTDFGLECFLNARWTPDGYVFRLISADIVDFSDSAFLLRKL